MTADLFTADRTCLPLDPGATLLGGFALDEAPALIDAIARIAADAPFRHLVTPGGHSMSVAMTNCGEAGWFSDRRGYRYTVQDPLSGRPWPDMPPLFLALAARAAAAAGFPDFTPDACLINRYAPGTRLTLHQDRDEEALSQPIVSVSLGVSATFLWGGETRNARVSRHRVHHGDVVVWGGPARMTYHGVDILPADHHPLTGNQRLNLTFRRARRTPPPACVRVDRRHVTPIKGVGSPMLKQRRPAAAAQERLSYSHPPLAASDRASAPGSFSSRTGPLSGPEKTR